MPSLTKLKLDTVRPPPQPSTLVKALTILLLFLGTLAATAKPKIAYVNMDVILTNYYRKAMVEKDVQDRIEALKSSPRVLAVQEMDAKLKELADTVRDKTQKEATRETAAEEFNSISIEYPALMEEMEQFLTEEKRKATTELVETIEDIQAEVRAEISAIGKSEGYDLILERGGKTSSQVSPIIYLRDGTDLTEMVLSRLNANAPAEEKEEESGEATATPE